MIKGTINNFHWVDRATPPTNRCIMLYHDKLDLYVGAIHIGMRSRNLNVANPRHYINIIISKDIGSEFICNDLDVAKLKAEIEAERLLKIAKEKGVQLCRFGGEDGDKLYSD